MRKFTLGIRSQLTVGIVLTTIAGIGLIGFLSVRIIETSAVYWKISEAVRSVRFIRAGLKTSQADRPAMLKYAGVALRENGVYDFIITDASGRILLRNGRPPISYGTEIPFPEGVKVMMAGGGFFEGAGDSLYIRAPLEDGTGGGRIELMVPLDEIREEMRGVRKFLLLYALLDSAIIIAFFAYFLSRSIIGPIRKLDEAATRISGGKLFERAQVSVDNEIGSLAASFNSMAERLEAEIKTLERVNMELLNTQDELLRSSTLAAMGRLAAGIAHEIGNPLGAVRGYLDILEKGGLENGEEREILERTLKEVSRIDSMVREFLDLSRSPRRAASPVDVNRVAEEAVLSARVHRDFSGVDARLDLRPGLPSVNIDDGKLRQVFINILINAAHSMEASVEKAVTVTTGAEKRPVITQPRRRKDDPPLAPPEAPAREYVLVSFTDRGTGISEEDARRIFDPFYTTKEVGKGTGLGLFVSQSIIKAYGGEIRLSTKPGGGSTFTVILPSGDER